MIKIHCDRCNRAIENKYYTIDICEHDLHPVNDYTVSYSISGCSNSRADILKTLNSQPIYCEKCKEQIVKWAFKM